MELINLRYDSLDKILPPHTPEMEMKWLDPLRRAAVHTHHDSFGALRLDDATTAVAVRALDYPSQVLTEVLYAELRAQRFLPTIGDCPPGAKTYTWTLEDRVGQAAAASQRGLAPPRADVFINEFTSRVMNYNAQYGYTSQELRAILVMLARGFPLSIDVARAKAAAWMIAKVIDQTVAFGDAVDTTVQGFLNNSYTTILPALGPWASLTDVQLLAQLVALATTQMVASLEVFSADTIILPTAAMVQVTNRLMGSAGAQSVLSFFKQTMKAMRNGKDIDVFSWPLLNTAGAGSTPSVPIARAVAYQRDVGNAGALVPLAFAATPPQAQGTDWTITVECECGGAVVRQPLGQLYMDGL